MGFRAERSISAPDLSDFSQSESNLSPEKGVFRALSAPVTLQWEHTRFCNHNCEHCYNYWRQEEKQTRLRVTEKDIRIYGDITKQIVQNKVFHVTVTGGEPLATLKWTYPYIKELVENEIGVSLNSNLTMLNRERAKLLREVGVRSILTSLIAADPELNDKLAGVSDAHKNTSRGIQLALDEGFWVAVNMVITKKNLHSIYDTAKYVRSLGVSSFAATKSSTPINCPDFSSYALSNEEFSFMVDELLRVREELGMKVDSLEFYPMCFFDTQSGRDFAGNRICNAGKTACTIGADGEIRPCSHSNQVYGFIAEDGGLKKAWENLHDWRTEKFIPDECSECTLKYICRGGCRTEAYAVHGNLRLPDPYCKFGRPPLPISQQKDVEIDLGGKFTFHPGIKTRKENFGGIIYITPVRWSAVTEALLSFYDENNKGTFTLIDLAGGLRVSPEETIPTAKILARKTIIQERR